MLQLRIIMFETVIQSWLGILSRKQTQGDWKGFSPPMKLVRMQTPFRREKSELVEELLIKEPMGN